MRRGAYIPYFKSNAAIFCCPFFFEEYLNLQVRINKVVNKHTVDYQPSLSELTSRNAFSCFYGLLRGLCLQNISWTFSQTRLPHHVWEKPFALRSLVSTFESDHFHPWPQAKLSSRFLSLPPSRMKLQKRGGLWSIENDQN